MLLEQLINAITLGCIYAIVALGYTLVFGVLDIINMAHGEIFMVGAFTGVYVTKYLGLPLGVAFLVCIIITGILGLLLEFLALRPLRRKKQTSALPSLISTIGISIILENLAHRFFGSENQPFQTELSASTLSIGGTSIPVVQLLIIGSAMAIMIGLSLWLAKTKAGKALRATAENPETARILGVNVDRVITSTVVLASMLGGIAGMLVGMALNTVNPQMGLSIGLKGLAIIILGGMGSVPGAMLGGIILGLGETLLVVVGNAGYRDAIAFVLIIVILLLRPQGILGHTSQEGKR